MSSTSQGSEGGNRAKDRVRKGNGDSDKLDAPLLNNSDILMDQLEETLPVSIIGKGDSTDATLLEEQSSDLSPQRRVRFWEQPEIRQDVRKPESTKTSPRGSPKMTVTQPNVAQAAIMAGLISQQQAERHPLMRTRTNPKLAAMEQRMKFYRALSAVDQPLNITEYPPHVLPPILGVFDIEAGSRTRKQSSISTVFCIWNTMLGSTLLTMPWGFAEAGQIPAVALTLFLCVVSLFTCNIVLNRGNAEKTMDFSALCLTYLGPWAHRMYQMASIFVFIGAAIAYHNYITSSLTSLISLGHKLPLFIPSTISGVLLFLLSVKKDPRFLVRLNSFGVLAVIFTMFFMIYQSASGHAAHVFEEYGKSDDKKESELVVVAPLAGMLGMSFFIHNAILPIMANNPNQKNNFRDLIIAFILALVCYISVGLIPTLCIDNKYLKATQNFLIPFPKDDVMACIARLALVIQLTTVYPLILYLIRVELFGAVLGRKDTYPGFWTVAGCNGALVGLTTIMAIKVQNIGDVLRWVGAISSFLVVFSLPSLVESQARRRQYQVLTSAFDKSRTLLSLPLRFAPFDLVSVFVIGIGLTIIVLQILVTI